MSILWISAPSCSYIADDCVEPFEFAGRHVQNWQDELARIHQTLGDGALDQIVDKLRYACQQYTARG